ncbi:MAG: hypothetical protein Q9161_001651 [Pseudevernia consocians]
MFKQLERQVTPVEFLQEGVMPDTDPAYILITDAVFKSDPAASVAVEPFSHGGQAQLKAHASRRPKVEKSGEGFIRVSVAESWLLQKCCSLSLEWAAKAMNDCIDRESVTEVELGQSLCASHARTTFAAPGSAVPAPANTTTDSFTTLQVHSHPQPPSDLLPGAAETVDHPIPTHPSKDPFVYNQGYGTFIRARSAQGRHLTWSLLEGAVVGLYNGLYLMGIYRTSEFRIWDGVAGMVEVGETGADVVGGGGGRNGTVRWGEGVNVGKWNGKGNGNGNGSEWSTRDILGLVPVSAYDKYTIPVTLFMRLKICLASANVYVESKNKER